MSSNKPNKLKSRFTKGASTRSPQPATPNQPSTMTTATRAGQEQVSAYLTSNPNFLESYVLDHVDLETLERWVIRKAKSTQKDLSKKSSLSKWKFCVHADKRAMLQEMTGHVSAQHQQRFESILYELANCIKGAIDADGFNLYIINEEHGDFFKYEMPDQRHPEEDYPLPQHQVVQVGSTVAAYVGYTKEKVRCKTSEKDEKYPDGIKDSSVDNADYYVMNIPFLCSKSGVIRAMLEFYRAETDNPEFHAEDEEIVNSYLVWGEVALHYAESYGKVENQKDLSAFLLNIVRSIFMEMVSMDALILKIMNFAQKLVSADRASLFLVDSKTNQLYARIFDASGKFLTEDGNGLREEMYKDLTKEIRFPVGTGIAGYVAETGETLNVHDVYKDPRFNASIDQQTGYNTKSILCMPICIRGQVIGVIQMINKNNGFFTSEDEEAFEMFAVYCGLALHHAKLYDKIRRSEQKYKVALEVLSYHNSSSANEVDEIVAEGPPEFDDTISRFTFYALNMDDNDKVRKALFMFVDLFGLERFDYEVLVRFFITVKKNYRQVAYHNWAHGFHVANSIYAILKSSPGVFKPLEVSLKNHRLLFLIILRAFFSKFQFWCFLKRIRRGIGWQIRLRTCL